MKERLKRLITFWTAINKKEQRGSDWHKSYSSGQELKKYQAELEKLEQSENKSQSKRIKIRNGN